MNPRERRMALLQRHLELSEHTFARSRSAGVARPVIFILDLEDREGRKLAAALEAKEHRLDDAEALRRIDAKAADIRTRGDVIPAMVMTMDLDGAAAVCRILTDTGEQSLRRVPPDCIPVVVVSAGGNSYASLPQRAR